MFPFIIPEMEGVDRFSVWRYLFLRSLSLILLAGAGVRDGSAVGPGKDGEVTALDCTSKIFIE